jgi:hypothetical protein
MDNGSSSIQAKKSVPKPIVGPEGTFTAPEEDGDNEEDVNEDEESEKSSEQDSEAGNENGEPVEVVRNAEDINEEVLQQDPIR